MNYDWTQSLCFAIIQKPMEKSYWLFVEGTSFMKTADPHTRVTSQSPHSILKRTKIKSSLRAMGVSGAPTQLAYSA